MELNELVIEGLLQFWATSAHWTGNSPYYAPASMKRPKNWKQPKRT